MNLYGTLDNTNSVLNLNATTGSWHLVGGGITGGTVNFFSGSKLVPTNSGGRLTGVTLNGDLDLTAVNSNVTVVNGLTLNGTATLGSGAELIFAGTQTLGGNGTVIFQDFSNNGLVSNTTGMTLTIGAGITIRGGSSSTGANIGFQDYFFGSGGHDTSLVLQGTIVADLPGRGIHLSPHGTGTLTNTGTITVNGGTLEIGGHFSIASLGTLNRNGGVVNIRGTLDNTNQTLTLDAARGTWNLVGGRINGGTVTETASGKLRVTSSGATLSGVTFNGDLDLTASSAYVDAFNGLTLNGTATLGNSARIRFHGTQTFGGTATVLFQDFSNNGLISNSSGMTLTIGPGITVRGGSTSSFGSVIGYSSTWGGGSNTSLILQGTVISENSGRGIYLGGYGTGTLTNTGSINLNGGNVYLAGNFTLNSLGALNRNSGSIYLAGTLNNVDNSLNLNAANGNWYLFGGRVTGGTISATEGSRLILTSSGGTLDGVVYEGDLDALQTSAQVTTINGLTLNGTATLGSQVRFRFDGTQTLGGVGTVTLENFVGNTLQVVSSNSTLTIGPGITVRGGSATTNGSGVGYSDYWFSGSNISLNMQGRVAANLAGGLLQLEATGTGTLTLPSQYSATNGATLEFSSTNQNLDPAAVLQVSANSRLRTNNSLVSSAQTAAQWNLAGTVLMSGGTSLAPKFLEVMSDNLNATAAGFNGPFTMGSLTLGSGFLRLVDTYSNSPAAGDEALYVNSLIIPSGSTLDLQNRFKVYTRALQQSGQVINGSITVIPDEGALALGVPTAGSISVAGQHDDWTFFAQANSVVTVTVNPGATSTPATIAPYLGWAQVELFRGNEVVPLATAFSSTSGNLVSLANVPIAVADNYRIRVKAAPGHTASINNYMVTAWNSTPVVRSLNFNQAVTGSLQAPFAADLWKFSANANDQIQFDHIAAASAGIRFSLHGPQGQVIFTDLAGDSTLLNLPATGDYSLRAQSSPGAMGAYSFAVRLTSVTDLEFGTSYQGSFAGSGQPLLFRVHVPDSQILSLRLQDDVPDDRIEMYLRFNSAPTREVHDYRFTAPGNTQEILVPSAVPGDWYVLVYSDQTTAGTPFSLRATGSAAQLTSALPAQAGNAKQVYTTIFGAGFANGTTIELVGSNGSTVIPPVEMAIDSFTQMTAVFPAGIPADTYSYRVKRGSTTDTLPAALVVTQGGQAQFEARLITSGNVGRQALATFEIEYANVGTLAMSAPLVLLRSGDADGSDRPILTLDQDRLVQNFWSNGRPPGTGNEAMVLASGQQPGFLNPGERFRVPVYFLGLEQPWDPTDFDVEFELQTWDEHSAATLDWNAAGETLRPATLTPEQWAPILANLRESMITNGDYVRVLNQNAEYLGRLQQPVTSVEDLWNFEVQQATGYAAVGALVEAIDAALPAPGIPLEVQRRFGSTLQARNLIGPFGRGWSASWQSRLQVLSGGDLVRIVGDDGSARYFQRDRRYGTFHSASNDPDKLLLVEGELYELQAVDGTITRFRVGGEIDYVRDNNNNRVTMSYSGGRLSGLAHSNGSSLAIAYNGAGRIASISDSAGRTTTFGYDATNNYLLTVTAPDGKITSHSYQLTGDERVRHALLSVERAGTSTFFAYDSRGRLDSTYSLGNTQIVDYSYNTTGLVTVATAFGANQIFTDRHGLVAKLVDPLGNINTSEFDSNQRLERYVSPTGEAQQFTWEKFGSLATFTNELGQTNTFAYDSDSKQLVRFIDARGNITRYSYDTSYNLLATTYANGVSETFSSYTTAGLAQQSRNRRGQLLTYQFNAAGQITRETYADGSVVNFSYDVRGNLLTVVDGSETTTLTYSYATLGDRLQRISYPNGRYVEIGYDNFGRRASVTDQDGFTTRYLYDSTGRLEQLRDGNDAPLVTYAYDAAGRMLRVDKANGSFTTYDYDAAGQLLSLQNWQNATTLNSRFVYTYDTRGRRLTMSTLAGDWSYLYDAAGQLTRAVFDSANTNLIADQDLQYFYDAAGNRVRMIQNGVTSDYVVNALNQYVSVGGINQNYDADGNLLFDGIHTFVYDQKSQLTRVTGPLGVTEYEYDASGDRVAVVHNGVREEFLFDPTNGLGPIASYGAAGTAHNIFGNGLEAFSTPAGTSFLDADALGSVVGVTTNTGAQVNRYEYDPYGQTLLSIGAPSSNARFLGKWGVVTQPQGIQLTSTRAYSSSTGRFLSQDSVGLAGGQANLYAYATNRPTTIVNPFGTFSTIPLAAGGVAVGGAAGAQFLGTDWGSSSAAGGETSHTWTGLSTAALISSASSVVYGLSGGLTGAVSVDWGAGVSGPGALVQHGIEQAGFNQHGLHNGLESTVTSIVGGIDLPTNKSASFGAKAELGAVRTRYLANIILGRNLNGLELETVIYAGGLLPLASGTLIGTATPTILRAVDPNQKLPIGTYGAQSFVAATASIPYQIDFENYSTATAPAQVVTIVDQLSADFDWSSFRLTGFGFGDHRITAPANVSHFQTTVRMTYNNKAIDVLVEAGLNVSTGLFTAIFQSLDPATELPPDVVLGFLPPEDGTGRGLGYVTYTVRPRTGLPTGATIRNVAVISFDGQLAISTRSIRSILPRE